MPGTSTITYDDGAGGYKQYTATLTVNYYKKYDGVTNMPSNASSSSTSSNSNGSVWLGVDIQSKIPVREGYTFLGWRLYDDDSQSLIQPGTTLTDNVKYGSSKVYSLYTRWSIKTNTITFYSNGGETATFTQTKNYGSSVNISSTIPTRTGYVFVSWNTNANGTGTTYNPGQAYSSNSDLNLYAVWRAASSVPTINKEYADIGTSVTISTNRVSSSALHTLAYSFEGTTGTIATNVATSHSWTVPSSFYNLLSSKVSAVCTIYCTTYVNGTKSGDTQSASFTVSVPSNIKPTISVSVSSVNEQNLAPIIGTAVVQGYSKVSFTFTSTPGTGASFSSYTISGPDLPNNISGDASTVVSNTISGTGTLTWIAYVTDSRGRSSNAVSVQVTALPYSRPSISPISIYRCNQNGTQDQASGTYLNSRSFYSGSNVGSNTITSAKVYYRRANGSSSWTLGIDLTNQSSAGSGQWTGAFGSGNIALEYSYEVKYEIQDSIGAATNQAAVYIVSYPVPSSAGISYGIYNDRLRLGGLVEEPGFVVDWASKFKNPLTIENLDSLGMTALITGEGDNISLLLTGNK